MSQPAPDRPAAGLRRYLGEPRSAVRRLLRRGPSPEERLAVLIDAHRRDLDAQRARFEQTIEDFERREQLLSDAKASVERVLRLGSRDLDAREADVARLLAELTERQERLRDEEAALARRRAELGPVELKRLLVEQRERSLDEREALLAACERGAAPADTPAPRLAFVPGTAYRLLELDGSELSGHTLVLEGTPYEIARVGPSPLPGDGRRCAYLVRGRRDVGSSDGSS